MGMFDTILCKYPLILPTEPNGYVSSESFQSKDLDNTMGLYEIRENGTLWEEKHEYKWIDGDSDAKKWSDRFGYAKSIRTWWDQVLFTNTIHLYDYQEHENGDYDYSIDYKIVFIKGVVSEVTISHFEARPNADRKIKNLEIGEQIKQIRDFTESKRYRYFYKHYNYVILFIFRRLYHILIKSFGWLQKTFNKLERWLQI